MQIQIGGEGGFLTTASRSNRFIYPYVTGLKILPAKRWELTQGPRGVFPSSPRSCPHGPRPKEIPCPVDQSGKCLWVVPSSLSASLLEVDSVLLSSRVARGSSLAIGSLRTGKAPRSLSVDNLVASSVERNPSGSQSGEGIGRNLLAFGAFGDGFLHSTDLGDADFGSGFWLLGSDGGIAGVYLQRLVGLIVCIMVRVKCRGLIVSHNGLTVTIPGDESKGQNESEWISSEQ